jgi:hypothetical protein
LLGVQHVRGAGFAKAFTQGPFEVALGVRVLREHEDSGVDEDVDCLQFGLDPEVLRNQTARGF